MNLMNHREIEKLQSVRDYPAISIFLPVYHESAGDLQQTPVRVKNLLRIAENRLLREFSEQELEPLKDKWESLAQTLDYKSACDGLALFISSHLAQAVKLPCTVPERVVVDETFATRDLVRAFNRSTQYRVLTLSREDVWSAAQEGKVDTLLVEEDFRCPACTDGSWIKPVTAESSALSGVTDDAVDEIVETVMDKGGQVSFFDHGTLGKYGHVAAILRY